MDRHSLGKVSEAATLSASQFEPEVENRHTPAAAPGTDKPGPPATVITTRPVYGDRTFPILKALLTRQPLQVSEYDAFVFDFYSDRCDDLAILETLSNELVPRN